MGGNFVGKFEIEVIRCLKWNGTKKKNEENSIPNGKKIKNKFEEEMFCQVNSKNKIKVSM